VVEKGVARAAELAHHARTAEAARSWLAAAFPVQTALAAATGVSWTGAVRLGALVAMRSRAVRGWEGVGRAGEEEVMRRCREAAQEIGGRALGKGGDLVAMLRLRAKLRGWRFRAARNLRVKGLTALGDRQRMWEAEWMAVEAAGEFWAREEEGSEQGGAVAQSWVEEGEEWRAESESRGEVRVWAMWKGAEDEAGGGKGRLRVEREAAWRDACAAGSKAKQGKVAAAKGRAGREERPAAAGAAVPGQERRRRTEAACARARGAVVGADDGGRADAGGNFLIDRVEDVRSWVSKTRFEALIRWRGRNPATGHRWEDSWVEAREMNSGAKEAARDLWKSRVEAEVDAAARLRALQVERRSAVRRARVEAFRKRPEGARMTPRVAERAEASHLSIVGMAGDDEVVDRAAGGRRGVRRMRVEVDSGGEGSAEEGSSIKEAPRRKVRWRREWAQVRA